MTCDTTPLVPSLRIRAASLCEGPVIVAISTRQLIFEAPGETTRNVPDHAEANVPSVMQSADRKRIPDACALQ